MRFAILRDQLSQTVSGTGAVIRHLLRPSSVETAISSFEADAPTISASGSSYLLVLAHRGARALWTTLLIDVRAVRPFHGDGHYAYFRRDLRLSARASLAIEIRYDWNERASFHLDGIELEPDVLWRGDASGAGDYFVTAALSTRGGEPIERWTLRQRLPA